MQFTQAAILSCAWLTTKERRTVLGGREADSLSHSCPLAYLAVTQSHCFFFTLLLSFSFIHLVCLLCMSLPLYQSLHFSLSLSRMSHVAPPPKWNWPWGLSSPELRSLVHVCVDSSVAIGSGTAGVCPVSTGGAACGKEGCTLYPLAGDKINHRAEVRVCARVEKPVKQGLMKCWSPFMDLEQH